MFKNISATAITLSLLLGTLALSPVSTAFAKPALGKAYYAKEGPVSNRHRRNSFVYDGAPFVKGEFRSTFRVGNRSISHQ
jgi:hypothetical protein